MPCLGDDGTRRGRTSLAQRLVQVAILFVEVSFPLLQPPSAKRDWIDAAILAGADELELLPAGGCRDTRAGLGQVQVGHVVDQQLGRVGDGEPLAGAIAIPTASGL